MKVFENGEVIIMGLEKIDLTQYPNLKVLGVNTTGLDHIDLKKCEKRKIKIISLTPPRDEETEEFLDIITSTAEFSFLLIGALVRNFKLIIKDLTLERETYKGHSLRGKILGLIGGNGRIGKMMVKYGEAFGMKVLIYDKKMTKKVSLERLLKKSDIVSLHINLDDNEEFFTQEMFKQMKPSSYLINTSRYGIIEKGALIWALKNNIIKGAAIDFIDDSELVEYSKTHNNLILTNHLAGATQEDMAKTEEFIKKKVVKYLQDK